MNSINYYDTFHVSDTLKNSVDVSVIIPIKDEHDQYIDHCLQSLHTQDYSGPFECLVITGGNRAQARNLGINLARGEIIAFIDSDCVAPKTWLSMLVSNLRQNATLGGIGGINISPSESPFLGKVIDFVFASYLGSLGSASLHKPTKSVFVDSLACINSAFWRKGLDSTCGFDEKFELCEDTNLSYNVRALGYKLLLNPKILVRHYRRDTILRFAKQFFLYGMGRMRSILTSREYMTKRIFVFFAGALSFPLIVLFYPLLALSIFGIYMFLLLFFGLKAICKHRDWRFLFLVPGLFITQHFSYLSGMLYGISKWKWKKSKSESSLFLRATIDNSSK